LRPEIRVFRYQLEVLGRKSPKRAAVDNIDRLLKVPDALKILSPGTALRWHRATFRPLTDIVRVGPVTWPTPRSITYTTGCFTFRSEFTSWASKFKCACANSCGVKAIYCASDTSMKRADLNSSRKRSGVLPVFSMKWLIDIGT
jgi:hypothetical protein